MLGAIRTLAAASLALLATVGCSSDDADPLIEELGVIGDDDPPQASDDAQVPDAEVPDAEVSADVAAALARAESSYAAAIAARLEHGAVTDAVEDAVAAAFAPQLADAIVAALRAYDDELAVFRAPEDLGPRVHTDLQVLERTEACIHVVTEVDARPLVVDAPARETAFVVLVPAPPGPGATGGSGWVIERLPEGDPVELRDVTRCSRAGSWSGG